MENRSCITHFILVAFSLTFTMRVVSFFFLLFIHIITLLGNFLIIFTIWKSNILHTAMYYFLVNLAFLEICFTSSIIPKLLSILAFEYHAITFWGCLTQCYFYFLLGSVELLLLAAMSFDRYVAVCYPLRYGAVMTPRLCMLLTLGCWIAGFIDTLIPTLLVSKVWFCKSNVINHFFCDVEHLLKLACSKTGLIQFINLCSSSLVVFGSLICIIVSYAYIIVAVTKISRAETSWKSFSTCASHLLLVVIIYGSSLFLCMRGITASYFDMSKLSAFMTGIVTPLLNPFIYTLKNTQDMPGVACQINSCPDYTRV
ncbi:olfactory receptor 6M1-like [Dendropsophus ebraccatus]|uniref:olfactory receptor 6M1-like n=1 Tax=Dendropsophus ebraccatus TaxID=150705 RepID=UPI00383133C3